MWDLDGLCDKEFLDNYEYLVFDNKIRFLFNYLIGCLYYNSEKYYRTVSLGLNYHEFTTSEEIFNETGIYSISFTEHFASQVKYSFSYLINYDDRICNNLKELFPTRYKSEDFFESLSAPNFDIHNIAEISIRGSSDLLIYFNSIFDIAYFYDIMRFISFDILCLGHNKLLCWNDLLQDNVSIYNYKELVTCDFISMVHSSNLGLLFSLLDDSDKEFPVILVDGLNGFYYEGRKLGFPLLFSLLDKKFKKVYIKYTPCHKDELLLFMKGLKDYLKINKDFDIRVKVDKNNKYNYEPDVYANLILGSLLEE